MLGMKNLLLSLVGRSATTLKIFVQMLLSKDINKQLVLLPVDYNKNKTPKNNFMGNQNSFLTKTFLLIMAALLFTAGSISAQVINEGFEEAIWTNYATGAGSSTYGSVTLPNVPANSVMSYLTSSTSFTTATNTCNNSGTWYYSKMTTQSSAKYGAGCHSLTHSIKLSAGGYIITPTTPAAVVNITFWMSNSSGTIIAGLATDPNAAGPGYNSSTSSAIGAYSYISSTYAQGTNTMQSYSFGGTFSGPCRFGIFDPAGTIYVDDIEVYAPTGNPPSVITNSATAAITNANVTGTVTVGATPALPLLATGIIWSTSPLTGTVTDTLQPKTKDIPASTGTYTDAAGPLQPGTLYYTEAYVIGLDGSIYFGGVLQFTTKPIATPTVVTSTTSSVLSYSAVAGGSIPDSGGCTITKKGVVWGTTANPVVGTNQTNNGSYGAAYSSNMSPLLPNTLYHYRAYAVNSCFPNTVIYGGDSTFTTLGAVPSLSAVPDSINFGTLIAGSPNPVLSYILYGNDLTPSQPVTINVVGSGYQISLSPSSNFSNSITINNPATTFKKPVYVKFLTSGFGIFNATVTNNGGGTVPPNADTVKLIGTIIQSPALPSNVGTEFWTGFAFEEKMQSNTYQFDTARGSANGAHMNLYIGAGSQPATVVVELPGMTGVATFPRTINIPANSVVTVGGFPVGDSMKALNPKNSPDCRLYYTGVTNRGIHIISTNGVPVSCWLYDWATDNSAAGTMLFPTNTWNSSYVVQAIGGSSNENAPNSFFYVIAAQDSTPITFTPSATIIDSPSNPVSVTPNGGTNPLYNAGTSYNILLNKGQVFNAMGLVNSGVAVDLSGTTISTSCDKKIAVFGGNGRCYVGTTGDNPTAGSSCSPNSGSDNLVQQMFPKVAWGTEYLTIPTKAMSDNVFRVYVQNPATNVWLNKTNGTVLTAANALPKTSLINNLYYQFDSYNGCKIQSDIPVSVTQFIISGSCAYSAGKQSATDATTYGNNGGGDPEMITLSPVQQGINNTAVYSSFFENGDSYSDGASYINVVVKGLGGVNSFKLDGMNTGIDTGASSFSTATAYATAPLINMSKAFEKDVWDTNYYRATFWVTFPAVHTLSSDSTFNAYAYGVAGGESYGYNAGTAIKNLSTIVNVTNPYGGTPPTAGVTVQTCINNPATLSIGLPYPPGQVSTLTWDPGNNPNVAPLGAVTVPATYTSTYTVNGDIFYLYSAPQPYTFSNFGTYSISVTANGTFASDCPGVSNNILYVYVGSDNVLFTATPAGCGSKNVTFTDSSTGLSGTSIVKWVWNYGDNSDTTFSDSTYTNPVIHQYPTLSNFWAKLMTINSIGCFTTDSVNINLSFALTAKFVTSADTICPGGTIQYTDSSSTNAASWKWHFGDPASGANDSSSLQNPTHTYTKPGIYIDSLIVFTSGGCPSNIFMDTIFVSPLPKPNFTFGGVCLPGSTVFTNTSDTATGIKPYTYLWNFGEISSGVFDTSTATNGVHTYTPPVPNGGYTVKLIATNALGCVDSISQNVSTIYSKPTAVFSVVKPDICLGDLANVLDNNQSTATNQTITQWHWTFGSPNDTTTSVNHANHFYNTVGTYTVKLVVVTDKGCMSDSSAAQTVKVNAIPTAAFVVPGSCLSSGAVTFTDQSTITPDDGTNTPFTYEWVYAPGATGTTQNGTYTYTNPGTYNVSETVTTAHGCSNTITQPFVIAGTKPRPYFYVNHPDSLCYGFAVTITDTSRIDVGTIGRVDIVWDVVNNPGVVVTVPNPGNGKPGTSTNYTYTYPKIGTYIIKMIVYAGTTTGCEDSVVLTTPITIYPQPTAGFIVPGSCLSGGAVTFTDQSTITPDDGTNQPFTYSWSFGGNGQNGTNTYTAIGTYPVTQTVTTQHGCTNSITQQFVIAGSKPRPYFYVSHPDSLCNGFGVTITDTSRIDIGTIGRVDIVWDVTGSGVVSTDINPSNGKPGTGKSYLHTYPTAGTYIIKLIAYAGSAAGCEDSVTLITPITVYPQPVAAFVVPGTCLTSGAVTFTDQSSITPDDGTNKPFTYSWIYNQNTPPATGTTQNGTYNYLTPGTYNVSQTVTTQHGCTNTITQPFVIAGSQPRPAFYVQAGNLCSNLPVTITDTSRLDVGTIKTVEIYWNWTGGGSPDITDNSPSNGVAPNKKLYTYTYPVLGYDKVYTIRLVAYSGPTCFHDTTINITVHGSPKIFFGSIPDICLNAAPVTITEASELNGLPGVFTYSCPSAPNTIVGGNTFDPTKLTTGPNTYPIQAIYTTSFGCADTATSPIRVLGLPIAYPLASYPLCENRQINFTDTSNGVGGTIVKYTWIIDGQTFNTSPVNYTYPSTINDVVKLVVTTSIGCSSDTAKLSLIVNSLPNVAFTIQPSICLPVGLTQFTDSTKLPGSVQPQFSYLWNFGDNMATASNPDVSVLQNPTHNYTNVANYNITLKVISSAGCDSTLTQTLLSTQIHPAPIASFTVLPIKAQVCLGDSILFTDNSSGIVVKSVWYFGDGIIDTSSAEYHTYASANNYTATHAVIDNNGCISVNNPTVQVIVDALPIVNAGFDQYVVIGDSVVLNQVSVVANNFTSWWTTWPYNLYLNDTSILNPVFAPVLSGTYTYTLHVQTQAGCTATDDINLIALDPPLIPNVFSPNGDGIHDYWEIGFLSKYPGATVKVFNRYGQLIYNVVGYAKPWDGTVNGSPLPIGTYYYVISPKNGLKDMVGSITIIR